MILIDGKGGMGLELRAFQSATGNALCEGKSVLLVAPTGLGKTVAAAAPFVEARSQQRTSSFGLLGTRMIYSLPLRALADGIADSIGKFAQKTGQHSLKPVVHYGGRPESLVFREPAIVTTIDQYLTAWSGAPLSFGTRHGHAAAGAALASYSVFDEVHLLAPTRGLPLLAAVLQQRVRWGLPSTVMTATLPRSVIDYLKARGLTLIQATSDEIKAARDDRRQVEITFEPEPVSIESRLDWAMSAAREGKKVIFFVNRVSTAIELYRRAEGTMKSAGIPVLLAHSRFWPGDRKRIERRICDLFGEDTVGRALLITTQVAEAGLNISADLVISELAPADTLVQRAGRCARFPPHNGVVHGQFHVFERKVAAGDQSHPPYERQPVERTREVLATLGRVRLDWGREQKLVNDALDELYGRLIRGESPGQTGKKKGGDVKPTRELNMTHERALLLYETAFHERRPGLVEEVLREMVNVEIVVQRNAQAFCDQWRDELAKPRPERRHPETLTIPLGTLAQHVRELRATEPEHDGEKSTGVQVVRVYRDGTNTLQVSLEDAHRLRPGELYVLPPELAGYDPDHGLTFVRGSSAWESGWLLPKLGNGDKRGPRQTYVEHAVGVWTRTKSLVEKYAPFLTAWARVVVDESNIGALVNSVGDMIRVASLLHDLGKLNENWQVAVHNRDGEPVARTTGEGHPPPHAYHCFSALRRIFRAAGITTRLPDFVALAAARHHTTGEPDRLRWDAGSLKQRGKDALRRSVEASNPALWELIEKAGIERTFEPGEVVIDTPGPADDLYVVYCLANRIIKLADWEDAADKEVELCFDLCFDPSR